MFNDTAAYYSWLLEQADPRTKELFMVNSTRAAPVCALIYLAVVYVGPKLMKYKKPLEIKWILVFYNFFLAIFNTYIVHQIYTASSRLGYNYACEPCRISYDPDEIQIISAMWLYYMSKIIELFDTLFFILRKKDNQLTMLHIYHHVSMFISMWAILKWMPTGTIAISSLINASIHVIMYTYYGLSAFGPAIAKYLWWKKYLTMIQLTQFATIIILAFKGIFAVCDYPLWIRWGLILYELSFVVLFGRFYVDVYLRKSDGRKVKDRKRQ